MLSARDLLTLDLTQAEIDVLGQFTQVFFTSTSRLGGETYNFKTLSESIGFNPRSGSDTEVVLHAYRTFGTEVFSRLRSMFALAIWDNQKRELILARDRFGIKPLYYYASKNLLVFASELRAVMASGLAPRNLSKAGLNSYLATGSIAAPLTIAEGVRQLLPGHYLRVKATESGSIECTTTNFARDCFAMLSRPDDRAAAVAQLRAEALEWALRRDLASHARLVAEVLPSFDGAARLLGLDPVEVHRLVARLADEVDAVARRAARAATGPLSGLPCAGAPQAEIWAEWHARWEVRLFAS